MTVDISEEKTQQLVAGCVAVIIGGGGARQSRLPSWKSLEKYPAGGSGKVSFRMVVFLLNC